MDPLILLRQWWLELNHINSILFSFLFILSYFYLLKVIRSNKLHFPPSPRKLPIIGNLHQIGTDNIHRSFRSLSDKYGPLVLLHFLKKPTLVVSSAEIARDIIKSHQDVFPDRPQTKAVNALFYGSDIAFCPFGDYWRQAKKICVQELLSQRRVQGFNIVREEEVANMVGKIRLSCVNGAAVDLTEMFATISNNIVSRSALGRVYEGQGNTSFAKLSKTAMDLLGAFYFEDMFPLLGWIDHLTGLAAKLKTTSKALHAFLDQVIQEHQHSEKDNEKSDTKDFVDILLRLQKDDKLETDLTRENIRAILLDMFIGGTDTTAATMEWAMAELVKNPRIMKKAQEEVRKVVAGKSKVDETDMNQLQYFKWIVKETLRLHALIMLARSTSASTKFDGYDIPSGTTVLINTWAIQRDPELWDRPEEFIPERFENISVDFQGQHNEFIPFGAGRRTCPGIPYATIETEYVLANLLYWFNWELPDGASVEDLDMNDTYSLVIRKKTPLRLVPVMRS